MGIACVCDGTSTSPYAAEAAEYVSSQITRLFKTPDASPRAACADIREELLQLRASAAERPINTPNGLPEAMRAMLIATATERRRHSHQTTVIAAHLTIEEGQLAVEFLQCGDSQLLVYGPGGAALWLSGSGSRGGVPEPDKPDASGSSEHGLRLRARSAVTDVLPDSPNEAIRYSRLRFARYDSILLGSDGLFNAFDDTGQLHAWLREHERLLPGAGGIPSPEHAADLDECLRMLHERLSTRCGDDDITFVWIRPIGSPTEQAEAE
jgi:serine/threonine protein phosphatase PrpC